MRLNRLELQGFKSFLDRTILTFEPGITGVVGPNGCGKSNIVDAIMWVMGEQSPKHLRGDTMTDIIFNGSDTRAPTSMAEVSLVLDRQGVALSPQFAAFDRGDEISVTRRIYRDGTGEFLINKTPCRLKDIHELFMDTGVGRRAYSIIEQGQIDRMINVKPEDRRVIFEEVAGITKYKAKRKEAERKLEQTRQNLLRLQDIIGELEKQIRSLKVQATRARKYREIKTELEAVDLHLLGRDLFEHKKAVDELESKLALLIAERSESDAAYGQMDAQVTELEVLRLDQEKEYQSLGEEERDLMLKIQRLEGQLSLFEERRKHIAASNENFVREETEISVELETIASETEAGQTERDTVESSLKEFDSEIESGEEELRGANDERVRAEKSRDTLSSRRNQIQSRGVALENQKQNAEARERELIEAQGQLQARLEEIVFELTQFREKLIDAEGKIESCQARAAQAETDTAQIHAECQGLSGKLSEIEELLFKKREVFHSKRSRLQSLEELQANLEGYSPTAREILLKLQEASTTAVPLAEVMQPEAEIEEHLELLLGQDMNTILVSQSSEAETLARLVQERGLERVRILALSEISTIEARPGAPEGATALLSKVRVRPGYEAAAEWWLGRTFLCESTDRLFSLRLARPELTLLTTDSRTIAHGDHSLSTGTLPTKTGVFARRREIEDLTVECAALDEELKRVTEEREGLLQHLQTQEKLFDENKDKLSSLHIESVEYRKEKEKIQLEISRAERDQGNAGRDSERNLALTETIRGQVVSCDSELVHIGEEAERIGTELAGAEEAIQLSSARVQEIGTKINAAKIERSGFTERLSSLEAKLMKLESDLHQAERRRESLATQRLQNDKELQNIDVGSSTVVQDKENSETDLSALIVKLADTKEAFNQTCTRLQDLREERNALQKRREEMLGELTEVELKIGAERSSMEQLKGISIERYQHEAAPLDNSVQIELEKLPLLAGEVAESWPTLTPEDKHRLLHEHLKTLREKIGRYGEVNLTAIQEFDEIQKRYDFLIEQKADLENSIKILEEAIQKIDESTKIRFSETFEAVNQKFKEIFPILFNGGKAELTLILGEGSLDAGVDIMVQPPGKRLQSITLLSGGEKALTAVSLVLAIFARKPSPFCLLDEVGAPLDDANVSRFNTVVKKMAEKTQFIVITHNKKTMEIAEALYGVTMERAGISKMTSVRLN